MSVTTSKLGCSILLSAVSFYYKITVTNLLVKIANVFPRKKIIILWVEKGYFSGILVLEKT